MKIQHRDVQLLASDVEIQSFLNVFIEADAKLTKQQNVKSLNHDESLEAARISKIFLVFMFS